MNIFDLKIVSKVVQMFQIGMKHVPILSVYFASYIPVSGVCEGHDMQF